MKRLKPSTFIPLITATVATALASAATEAPAWRDFVEGKARGEPTLLADFSYAGYHFSEKPIPNLTDWTRIDVSDYGALPDDNLDDSAGIQAALDAAHQTEGPVMLRFPAGKFITGIAEYKHHVFEINRSHIVLQGAGSHEGGTEIYVHEHRPQKLPELARFMVRPPAYNRKKPDTTTLATTRSAIPRGGYQFEVDSVDQLSVGQDVVFYHKSVEAITAAAGDLEFSPIWKIRKSGIRIQEEHTIVAIEGNTVTFKNPIQLGIPAGAGTTEIRPYAPLEEIGIEGIRFSSGWASHPQTFKHHMNWEVDNAYRGMHVLAVKNAWIRDCEFSSWNVGLVLDDCMAVTVQDVAFSGKHGHTSTYPRDCYGVLYERVANRSPYWHGIGFRWATTACVYLDSTLLEDQSIDCHGFHPYTNLVDNVAAGRFTHNGGSHGSYPNSGPDFTFWNFIHDATDARTEYDFWSPEERKLHNYLRPKFIGLQSPGETVTFEDEGLDELRDQPAYPQSLFRAQLQLRLHGSYMSASSSAPGHPAVLANDGDPNTLWIPNGEYGSQYLQLDLGAAKTVSGVRISEPWSIVLRHSIHAWIDEQWKLIHSGGALGPDFETRFDPVVANKLKLTLHHGKPRGKSAAIAAFTALLDD